VLALLRHPPDPGMVYFAVGDCFGVLLGVLLRRTIHLAEDLRAADARLAESAGRAERERIARDVHDLVAHSLTVVVLHVGGARRVLRADPAAAERALEDAERVCRESLDGIRGVVGLLRGDDDSSVLSLDLEALAATYRAAGVPVALAVSGDPTTLPLVTRVTLYRVLQEAFANAARHSGPGAVAARITAAADSVMVSVENPLGVARPGAPGTGGFGLAGLREQVAAQAGELSGGPEGGAWVVRCRLPVASPSPVSTGSP
jgi:signal transduction histidine kinase